MDDVTLLPPLCLLAMGNAAVQMPKRKPCAEVKYSLIWKYTLFDILQLSVTNLLYYLRYKPSF